MGPSLRWDDGTKLFGCQAHAATKHRSMNSLSLRRLVPEQFVFSSWHAADGWMLRRFDWPHSHPKGSLLFLGGRGDFAEKYLEAFHHWHRGGWALTGFDWRGQGGSGRFLPDPLICHIPDFDALLDDLDAFMRDWQQQAPRPHVIVAHSMGAHLALRLLAARQIALHRLVLLSPMLSISVRRLPSPAIGWAARAAVKAGFGERRIWNGDPAAQRGHMTSCRERHQDKLWWKAERPEIASGPASWRWLDAACTSIAKLPVARLASIRVPALLLAARRDPVIATRAIARAAAALPNGRFLLLDRGGHELLRERDALRLPVLDAIDGFMRS